MMGAVGRIYRGFAGVLAVLCCIATAGVAAAQTAGADPKADSSAAATPGRDSGTAAKGDKAPSTPPDPEVTHSLFEQAFEDHDPSAIEFMAVCAAPIAIGGVLLWRARHAQAPPPPPPDDELM